MKLLWKFLKFFTPIILTFMAFLFPENRTALLIVAFVTSIYFVITYINNEGFENNVFSKIEFLKGLIFNQKRSLNSHRASPHIVATARIHITNIAKISESHGVSGVIDQGVGDFQILISTPFSHRLTPNIESDSIFSPKVEVKKWNDSTSVHIQWKGCEPKTIYFSLSSSEL